MRRQILTILILLFSFLFPIRAEVLSNKKEVPGELIISKEIVTIHLQRKEKKSILFFRAYFAGRI